MIETGVLLEQMVAGCRRHAAANPTNAPSQKGRGTCIYFNIRPKGRYYELDYTAPVCLLGHALSDIEGAPIELVDIGNNTRMFSRLLSPSRGDVDQEINMHWLAVVQSQQDQGSTWGEAVAYADSLGPEDDG